MWPQNLWRGSHIKISAALGCSALIFASFQPPMRGKWCAKNPHDFPHFDVVTCNDFAKMCARPTVDPCTCPLCMPGFSRFARAPCENEWNNIMTNDLTLCMHRHDTSHQCIKHNAFVVCITLHINFVPAEQRRRQRWNTNLWTPNILSVNLNWWIQISLSLGWDPLRLGLRFLDNFWTISGQNMDGPSTFRRGGQILARDFWTKCGRSENGEPKVKTQVFRLITDYKYFADFILRKDDGKGFPVWPKSSCFRIKLIVQKSQNTWYIVDFPCFRCETAV